MTPTAPLGAIGGRAATIRPWLVAVALVAVVVAAHGGAVNGGFHYDDRPAITDNLSIRTFHPLAYFVSPYSWSAEPGSAGFRPITVLTLAANYALGGLDPFGYLVGNLLLHTLVSLMAFVVGRELLRDDRWAACSALAYAVHPLNAESVNYVVARSSLLVALGGVAAIYAFLRRQAGGSPWWTGGGVTAFGVALLSKESGAAIIVPLAVAAVIDPPIGAIRDDGARQRRTIGRRLRAIWPYAAALAGYLAAWWIVAGTHTEQHGRAAAYPGWTFLEIVARSLLLWVWPHPLGLDHGLLFTSRFDAATAGWVVVGIGALVGVVVACWRWRPLVSWCLVWALAGLVPVAPLPWMTVNGLMQENRMAFSTVALAWLTALAAREVVARWRLAGVFRSSLIRRPVGWVAIGALSVIVVFAVITDRARSAVWRDDVALWQEVAARSPDSRSAHINLGGAYMAREEYDRAEGAFRRAVAITPDEALPYYALGRLAYRRREYDQARLLFLKTASMAPDYAETYRMLGIIAIKQNRDEEAAVFLQRALRLDPRDAAAQAHLGLVAQRAGDDTAALRWYRDSLAVDPAQSLARNNLGTLYLKQRQWADALEQFSELLAREPNDYDAALNRAVALSALGRREEAKAGLDALVARLPPDPRYDPHRRSAALMLGRVAP